MHFTAVTDIIKTFLEILDLICIFKNSSSMDRIVTLFIAY